MFQLLPYLGLATENSSLLSDVVFLITKNVHVGLLSHHMPLAVLLYHSDRMLSLHSMMTNLQLKNKLNHHTFHFFLCHVYVMYI